MSTEAVMSKLRWAVAFGIALAMSVLLSSRPASAAEEDAAKKEPARRPVVAVFRLSGPLTESPTDESIPLFSPPGTSLKDLVSRLRKAADDPAVKAVVIVSEAAEVGHAQV